MWRGPEDFHAGGKGKPQMEEALQKEDRGWTHQRKDRPGLSVWTAYDSRVVENDDVSDSDISDLHGNGKK